MDTRNSTKVFIAGFILLALQPAVIFAGPVKVYGGSFELPIPAPDEPESEQGRGWMDDAIIEITDHFTIYDLDVALNIKHTNAPDLHIFIQGPSGKRIYLNKYESTDFPEGKHPNYDQTIFDDEAAVPIEEAESPFTGRFRPLAGNQLNIFDGDDVFGTWRLQIHDAHYDDIGNLESFELMVTIPEPATVTLFSFSTMIVLLRNSRRLW